MNEINADIFLSKSHRDNMSGILLSAHAMGFPFNTKFCIAALKQISLKLEFLEAPVLRTGTDTKLSQ